MWTMRSTCLCTLVALLWSAPKLEAATIFVAAGGDLQKALTDARPGDTILLQENAEFVGNFVLPVKTGDAWITLRSAAPDTVLPAAGVRIQPSHTALLARLRSPNSSAALRTAPGAHHWDIRYIEFRANQAGLGDIIQLGDGSSVQKLLAQVPHHLVLNHVYVHGDPLVGQKRGIALNAATVTISDSHISDCKGIGQDTQAIGGWNGPGPYLIENNYLEAAGENVMFGGADPAITNLVADGVTVRRNYFSRPMSWRNPIVSTPAGLTVSEVIGGSLAAGVYGYRVVARRTVQSTTARSAASAEVTVTATGLGAVRVRWQSVPGTTEYWVYGRTPGAGATFWVVTGTEFVDTGAAGTSGAVPTTAGSRWSVKNIFELKNARNVLVEENIFENHWKESQPGYAIVLTPRNSQGACTWCVVEHVRFERNIVRNVAAGINVLGYDTGSNPSRQTNDIAIRQNVFVMSTSLGGNGWFMLIGEGPRDIVIEHNTIDSDGNAVIYAYGGNSTDPREIYGFEMIANAARHNNYGINGQYFSYGNAIIAGYFPGGGFERNYLAGGASSRLPAGTLVTNYFQDQFIDIAAGDYALRPASVLRGAALDGSDIGADYPALDEALEDVTSGQPRDLPDIPVPPSADFTSACSFLSCTFSDTSMAGSSPIASRTWSFGDGSDPTSGSAATHVFQTAGTFSVTLTATDANGLSSTASKTVTLQEPNVAPVAAFTASCVDLTCSFTDGSTDADGTVAGRMWVFGAETSGAAAPSYTFAAPGSYAVTLTVTDDDGATGTVTNLVAVTRKVHTSYSGTTKRWSSASGKTNYWSADVSITVHGLDERPIAGAAVTAAWTGAVVKTVTCVTTAAGSCVLKSGTLSYGRSWVTLNVTGVTTAGSVYDPAGNHTQAGAAATALTLNRP
jgi:PKD repeat protein